MFDGLVFYIINSNEAVASKANLEVLIAQHGGDRVQSLLPSTTHVIASKSDFKVRALVEKYDMNIVHYQWVVDCASRHMLLELEPRYMVYSNAQLNEYFKCCLDKYGDHYTQPVDEATLQQILAAMQIESDILLDLDPEVKQLAGQVLSSVKTSFK